MLLIRPSPSITSKPFSVLVAGLKKIDKKCTVIESSCGGLINASIMAVPGSSQVYYGGSVAYNTKQSLKLLLNDSKLHKNILSSSATSASPTTALNDEEDAYIRSKIAWTKKTAIAFCEQLNVDYAIAEGGATGPTFRPKGMAKGFAVIAIAGRRSAGQNVELLAQTVIRSDHANRQANMRLFADAAAMLAAETIFDHQVSGHALEQSQSCVAEADSDYALFFNSWLDRATSIRAQGNVMEELEKRPNTRCIVLRKANECLFQSSDSETSATLALLGHDIYAGAPKTFLGLLRPKTETGQVSNLEDVQSAVPLFGFSVDDDTMFKVPPGTHFRSTRTHAPLLKSDLERDLVLYATAMAQWKKTHAYCSSCGSRLVPIHGGTCLKCTNQSCPSPLSWPRQDPSIIVLVTNRNGDRALLARSKRHPAKVHTALAGFVEAGETMEDAVARETLEETGVRVDMDSITYVSSQPWPFPRSTMLAFRATASDDPETMPIQIDDEELVSASWFDKADVAAAAKIPGAVMDQAVAQRALEQYPSLRLLIPPKGVVARTLMQQWLEDE
jgi:NAD+ diphosphatase